MDLDVVFLGTSGSMPTAQRAPTAILIRRGGERLLFDCAEGTQRQLLRSNVGLIELREVFLTHYHADHYLGLSGMLKTFALRGRETPITIYGPPGLAELFGALRRIFGRLTYPYELIELQPVEILERGDCRLATFPVDHGVSALGYALIEEARPGRFDVEVADALGIPAGPERGALQRGEAVTLPDGRVIAPESVLGEMRPGRKLVVSADAAEVAREAEVGLLALTHLSNRYFGGEIEREAQAVFPNTVVPRDLDIIVVPFPERGSPELVRGGATHKHRPSPLRGEAVAATVEEGIR